MNKKLKICVIHSNNLFKCGLNVLLKESGYTIVDNELISQSEPDILLYEITSKTQFESDMNYFKKIFKYAKIVVLVHDFSEDLIKNIFKFNINGIIGQQIDDEFLLHSLNFVQNNGLIISGDVNEILQNSEISPFFKQKMSRNQFKDTHSNLTQREYEVLKLVVDGKSNAQIATELTISEHTAKAHVCNIIQKLVVDDRTQAAVKALKEGII
ncbi:response regulator transcription factor [bacterium]|nr:response regulator transcription factor [bacterium]